MSKLYELCIMNKLWHNIKEIGNANKMIDRSALNFIITANHVSLSGHPLFSGAKWRDNFARNPTPVGHDIDISCNADSAPRGQSLRLWQSQLHWSNFFNYQLSEVAPCKLPPLYQIVFTETGQQSSVHCIWNAWCLQRSVALESETCCWRPLVGHHAAI